MDDPLINRWNGQTYSQRFYDLLATRQALPVWQIKADFVCLLNKHPLVMVFGFPGSGKSTQIPQFVLETLFVENPRVCCTQPNRVATLCASHRAAEEMDLTLGLQVGYSARFENHFAPETNLLYITDDMLLREAMADPTLSRYNVIILDEINERTLPSDLLMGHLLELLDTRPDLKLVVMSSDISQSSKYHDFFDNPPALVVPDGVPHHVDVLFLKRRRSTNYIEASIEAVLATHQREPPGGDILLFLPSRNEVEFACQRIIRRVSSLEQDTVGAPLLEAVPVYPELPVIMQQLFEPAPHRKVFVSTDICETSLSLNNVAFVIDPGYTQSGVFRQRIGVEVLKVCKVSVQGASQRMACAGRSQNGKCIRLYTRKFHDRLETLKPPRIHQSDMASMVLALKKLNAPSIPHFDYMDPPALQSLLQAFQLLDDLGIIDEDTNLTNLGEQVTEFHVNPLLGKMIVQSANFNCSREILTIAAMLSVPSCLSNPEVFLPSAVRVAHHRYVHVDGDLFSFLNLFDTFVERDDSASWCMDNMVEYFVLDFARHARLDLENTMSRLGLNFRSSSRDLPFTEFYTNIMKSIVSGFFMHLTLRKPEQLNYGQFNFWDVENQSLLWYRQWVTGDPYREWAIFNDLFQSTLRVSDTVMTNVAFVYSEWLAEFGREIFDVEKLPESSLKSHLRLLL